MTSKRTYRQALCDAIALEMERDPRVVLFGLDVDDHKRIYGSTEGLVERFGPGRCFGTPISEDAMTGMALGAALSGLRPIHVHIRADFLALAMNQLINMVSIARYMSAGALEVPLVIRAVVGRGWGQSAQHSKSMHSILGHIPGLKVVMPATPNEARGLMLAAIRDPNPVIVLEHRWLYDIEGSVSDGDEAMPIGPLGLLRSGADLTIVATSWMNVEALRAAALLARRGVDVEVLNARSIAPFDDERLIESVSRTRHCIVADNDWLHCGFSAEISARVMEKCFDRLASPVTRIGWAPVPCPTARVLEDQFYANAAGLIREVEKKLGLEAADLSREEFDSYENRFKGPF